MLRALLVSAMTGLVCADLSKLPKLKKGYARLYLCRHGETDWNAAKKIQGSVDRELNAFGRRQAAAVGEALKDVPLSLVASSPLSRASTTADAVSLAHPGAARVRHAGLREMDFGDLEGTVPGDVYAETNAAWASGDLDRSWPNGEAPSDVVERGRDALRALGLIGQPAGADPEHAHAAIVCHGRFNKILLSSILGRGVERCGDIVQGNCCINVVDVRVDAPAGATDAAEEVLLNYVAHLEALEPAAATSPTKEPTTA